MRPQAWMTTYTPHQVDVIVLGVLYSAKGDTGHDEQGRRSLMLYEKDSSTVFFGKWTKYRRVPEKCGSNFDVDDDSVIK